MAVLALGSLPPRSLADCVEAAPSVTIPLAHTQRTAGKDIPLEIVLLDLSSRSTPGLTGRAPDSGKVVRDLDRLAQRIRGEIAGRRDPESIVSAMNAVVFGDAKFAYDPVAGNPENYLLDRVLEKKQGNCLGMTVLYVALGERLGIPLRGVYVPSHCFARFDDGETRINIEMGKGGAAWDDARYAKLFNLSEGRPYLRSLDRNEMIGVYLKSLGAACGRKEMDSEAFRLYDEAARYYPGLPDVYYNAGVLLMREGKVEEAIAQYRRALALDPQHASIRNNLGAALARQGRIDEALPEAQRAVALAPGDVAARGNLAGMYLSSGMTAEGIREYNRILEIDNRNPGALAGLVRAYFIRGEYRDALAYCDRANRLGCRIDPLLQKALEARKLP